LLPVESLGKPAERGAGPRLDRAERKLETGRHLALREPVEIGERDDLTLAGRQRVDRQVDTEGIHLCSRQGVRPGTGVDRLRKLSGHRATAASGVDGRVAGNREYP